MAVDKYKRYLYVFPEDDANRQIAESFRVQAGSPRQVKIYPPVGGWGKVMELITDRYVRKIKHDSFLHVLGVIDCDGKGRRIIKELKKFPGDVRKRIFLLGTLDEPETFSREVNKNYEAIGEQLADECFRREFDLWEHPHLAHLGTERQRTMDMLRQIVFDA